MLPVIIIEDNLGWVCTGNGAFSDFLSDVSGELDAVDLVAEEHLVVRLDGCEHIFSLDGGLGEALH